MKPTPEQIRGAREAANLSPAECAKEFGYKENSWRQKEFGGTNGRGLTWGEYQYLLLRAGQHPDYILVKR